jgi:hypothetical protein
MLFSNYFSSVKHTFMFSDNPAFYPELQSNVTLHSLSELSTLDLVLQPDCEDDFESDKEEQGTFD